MDLQGKHILITGAARGLGRELAARLADEGASLILVDREPVLQEDAQTHLCDLSDLAQRKKLIAHLQTSRPDILVNCAGIGSHSLLNQLTVDEVERVMQVNALPASPSPSRIRARVSRIGIGGWIYPSKRLPDSSSRR